MTNEKSKIEWKYYYKIYFMYEVEDKFGKPTGQWVKDKHSIFQSKFYSSKSRCEYKAKRDCSIRKYNMNKSLKVNDNDTSGYTKFTYTIHRKKK